MPPNVVILYADDLGWGDLPAFGAEELSTPALDRLRARGVRLREWYANSPVCSPSRASLLTGKYPAHAGVETILGGERGTTGLPHQQTLASELRARGYRTGHFGKWHLGVAEDYRPTAHGFDESYGFRAGCVDYFSHIYYWGSRNPVHDLWDDSTEVWENGEYLTTVLGERASAFIERNRDVPFFCFVPFNAPHYPLHAPQEYIDRFLDLPEERRVLAAMIAAMDDAILQILETLDEHGLTENTLVFFSSDNGPSRENRNWLNGEEVSYTGGSTGGLRGAKGSLFEGGVRVPALVSWPAQLPHQVDAEGVGVMMDLLPTILEAVDGSPSPTTVDGTSLLPWWKDPTEENSVRRTIFWTHDGQWAARSGRFKLVVNGQEGMTPPAVLDRALFDLEADAAETTDVRFDYPVEAEELAAELHAFRALHGEWTRMC